MPAEFDLPFPHYRCPSCGKDLPLGEARMTVTCGEHTEREDGEFTVRRSTGEDTNAIETICDRAVGETIVDAFGKTFDVLGAINLLAEADAHHILIRCRCGCGRKGRESGNARASQKAMGPLKIYLP